MLKIPPNIISQSNENEIINKLFDVDYPFSCVSSNVLNKCKLNTSITEKLICSLKSAYVLNFLVMNYNKVLSKKKYIASEYSNNNILHLSKKYKISPINIFRIVLIARGLNNKEIMDKIKIYVHSPSDIINEYDEKQFQMALKYDIYSLIDQTEILKKSLKFEKKIEQILIENNVKYKTQEQLTHEQKKEGKVFSTPDFLIISPLKINDFDVYWIDAKNFYGANTNFIKSKIKKQTIKYIQLYGAGCIIFNHGLSEKLHFDNIFLTNIIF